MSSIHDDLFLTTFTFDKIWTLELMEPYCDLPFSFHDHGSQVVAEMLRDMIYLPGLGLGR